MLYFSGDVRTVDHGHHALGETKWQSGPKPARLLLGCSVIHGTSTQSLSSGPDHVMHNNHPHTNPHTSSRTYARKYPHGHTRIQVHTYINVKSCSLCLWLARAANKQTSCHLHVYTRTKIRMHTYISCHIFSTHIHTHTILFCKMRQRKPTGRRTNTT